MSIVNTPRMAKAERKQPTFIQIPEYSDPFFAMGPRYSFAYQSPNNRSGFWYL